MVSLRLEPSLRETMRSLHSARLVVLTLLWGWVVGPAFAVLLTKVLPLAEPHAWRGIDVEIREERGKVLAKIE